MLLHSWGENTKFPLRGNSSGVNIAVQMDSNKLSRDMVGVSFKPGFSRFHVSVGQNQWYHFGVGAPPVLVYLSGDSDVHWGYGILTHGHVGFWVQFHWALFSSPAGCLRCRP